MNDKLKTNYDPETEIFTLNDQEESCLIVLTKRQLQSLLEIYHRCCE